MTGVDPSRWIGKALARCMGGSHCKHPPGTCTADPDYQRFVGWERDRLKSPTPTSGEAAKEVGLLATRILQLAAIAGLYVEITIKGADRDSDASLAEDPSSGLSPVGVAARAEGIAHD